MHRSTVSTLFLAIFVVMAGCAPSETVPPVPEQAPMTFFLTSQNPGSGADLGGLDGADAWCAQLADSVGAGDQTWHAYLSTTSENARDRIGSGPWHNAAGVEIAADLDALHGENNLTKETQLNERGEVVNGRGDTPNRHDILTGSTSAGLSHGTSEDQDFTCSDWTSSADDGSATVGHHDRTGGGADPTSWNAAHASRGCGLENLQSTGGDGLFYCFAVTSAAVENQEGSEM